MSRIIQSIEHRIEGSASLIGFAHAGHERFLTLEGKKAYLIGVNCDTCEFVFERLEGANQSHLAPADLANHLRTGLQAIKRSLLDRFSQILPAGEYFTSLLTVQPDRVKLGSAHDYFANEQVQVWGIDSFWGLPNHPKVSYYRGESRQFSNDASFFEFLVPMTPQTWLHPETLDQYRQLIQAQQKPTAVAISVLDIRQPAFAPDTHYCLSHYLLDGHHKIEAASQQKAPITLLSFLAVEECMAQRDEIKHLLSVL